MKKLLPFIVIMMLLAGCVQGAQLAPSGSGAASTLNTPGSPSIGATPTPTAGTPSVGSKVPAFDHIVLIILENQDFQNIIGNSKMPQINALAQQNVLLTNYYAVTHPSLPNYIALVSGSTQGITSDCTDCYVNQPNLADLIEASGRTWKTYQEDMPAPCTLGNAGNYAQKHNPFIYFDAIRNDKTRCDRSIVPLTQLESDLAANLLPNFSFIMPNLCNSGHDCSMDVVDKWVGAMVGNLQASPALGKNSLIIITYDEGGKDSTGSCCSIGKKGGGQVATILISPEARAKFADSTAYSHYSLLKTILTAWNLKPLGETAKDANPVIEAPWNKQTGAVQPTPAKLNPEVASAYQTTDPPKGSSLAFPIRAAFYYPWFPEAWKQNGMDPFTHYQPTAGFYSQDDAAVIQAQISAMQYGKIEAGISSWWGQGTPTDKRFPFLLAEGEKTGFYWAAYYEQEGYQDPPVTAIQSDLAYLQKQYASSKAYLKVDGRMVVFVYADSNDRCSMVDRWVKANTVNAYLVLKVFPGYHSCTSQPDGWHQYAPATAEKPVGKSSFTISPGFWKAGVSQPDLPRDLQRWNSDIRAMMASDAPWQLVTTFNEWGEGTAVEGAQEWQSPSGYGLYLDALHNDGKTP